MALEVHYNKPPRAFDSGGVVFVLLRHEVVALTMPHGHNLSQYT